MFRHRSLQFSVVFSLAVLAAANGGCSKLHLGKSAETAKNTAPIIPVKTGPTPPQIDYAKTRPDELGRIPVIMYHEVLPTASKPLTRTIDGFKKDLELMEAAGFVPVNLSDAITGNISVPAGKSPIVLTFDDARASQLKLIETASSRQVDPNCAVGIMQAFSKSHPDFPLHATFFVLPKSKTTMEPFGQLGMGGEKMAYLVANGMELGDHTVTHHSLRGITPAQIQAEIGGALASINEACPDAKVRVFAVPMGQFPRNKQNWKYLAKGTFNGTSYDFAGVMDAAWRPMPSFASKEFNPLRLERIDSIDGTNGVRYWIKKLSEGTAMYRKYVSDGDPNVVSYPKGMESEANLAKIKSLGKLANVYSPFGGTGGSKPILSAADAPAANAASDTAAAAGAPPPTKPIVGADKGDPAPAPAGGAKAAGAQNATTASGAATINEKPIAPAGG